MVKDNLETRNITVGDRQYSYNRPIQSRQIPLKATSNRGFIPSLKPHLKGLILEYESQLERDFLLLLDHDPNCIDLQPQPVAIQYTSPTGNTVELFPDCWAIFSDGREFLFEVKSGHRLSKLMEDEDWRQKVKIIQAFCTKLHWTYQIVTERKIHCVRLNNIKDTLAAAKHFSPTQFRKDIGKFESSLGRLLASPLEFRNLARTVNTRQRS